MLDATSPTAPWKYQLQTFRYNSLVFPMLGSLVRPSAKDPGNGFRIMPADRPQDLRPRFEDRDDDPGPVDGGASQLYADFIGAARAHGVQVVMVDSPRWRPSGMDAVTRIGRAHLRELAARHDTPFIEIDEFSHPVFLDPSYFADVAHLNQAGATLFSELLADELVGIVEKPSPPVPMRRETPARSKLL